MEVTKGAGRKSTMRKNIIKSSRETLKDILMDLLKDIYGAEKYLVKSIPKMLKASHNTELTHAFERHLEETKSQVTKIEECFEVIHSDAVTKKCEAMEGLVRDGVETIEDHARGHARDAAIIATARKIEHYEISAYATMRSMANGLGYGQCEEILQEIEMEERNADAKLMVLGERINQLAAKIDEEEAE